LEAKGIVMSEMNQRATMTEKEFCERVGISRVTAYRLREAGKLPHIRIGRKVGYLPKHVDEFFEAHEVGIRESRRSRNTKRA